MRRALSQYTAITGLTAVESMRQPICLLLTASAITFIAMLPLLITHGMGESGKLVRDSAFAIHFVFGLVLSTYTASLTLVQEMRRGTIAAILSKPVSRELFILAKFSGIALVMLLFSLMVSLATIISTRTAAEQFQIDWYAAGPLLAAIPLSFLIGAVINYFSRRPFVSNAWLWLLIGVVAAFAISGLLDKEGHWQSFGALFAWRLLPACVLTAMAILLLQAIAAGLATRLDAVPVLVLCSLLFLLGLTSDFLFGRRADDQSIASIAWHFLPNWQHFWQVDALTADGRIPWGYVLHTGKYAALYLAGTLMLTLGFFRSMEIK